jgi:hypothetical protein
MLYEFSATSSDSHTQIALFKANSVEDVARHILESIRNDDDDGKKYLRGMRRLEIGCCHGIKLVYNYKTKDAVVAKYLKTLNVDEFLEILRDSHPHSGGDIDKISITKFNPKGIIDLTL